MTEPKPTPKLDAALAYFRDGYSPWPVITGDKMPIRVKRDDTGERETWGGRKHRPLTEAEIRRVWGGRAQPDIGLVIRDDHYVLDLDPKNNPAVTAMFAELLQTTRCAYTPSGGLHAYFSCHGRRRLEHPALGVDLVGWGGFIVAPPSKGRTWANDLPEALKD